MGEFVGDPDGAWRLQCTLSLASCRLRAESLARRLHSKLWAAGRYEGAGGPAGLYGVNGIYDRCQDNADDETRNPQASGKSTYGAANERFVNGYCWGNAATAMFAAATINSTSLDGEEYYDCEGRLSSPPSPADEEGVIVNPPVGLPAVPALALLRDEYEEEEPSEDTEEEGGAMLSHKSCHKMVTSNEILFEKLILIADSLNLSAEEDDVKVAIADCNGVVTECPTFKSEKLFAVSPSPDSAVPNGDFEFNSADDTSDDVSSLTESTSPVSPNTLVNKFKFSVTPVVEVIPPVRVESPESETVVFNVKSAFSIDSIASLSLDRPSTPTDSFYGDDDDEDDISRRKLLLRSTSLKSGKTPPGTPRRKKIVRFADALGLDLEAVRHIVNDDLPNVPASAYTDLKLSQSFDKLYASSYASAPRTAPANNRVLYPQFAQPVTDPYFLERVRTQKVCLENIVVSGLSVYGVVRVLNISFEKSVMMRYTTDEWRTFYEVPSSYVPDSHDGFSDRFRFTLHQPGLSAGQRLIMAVRYIAAGADHWDNNYGNNYLLRCHLTSSSPAPRSPSNEGMFSFI